MKAKPKFKICKRLGQGVYDKCQTSKFSTATPRFGRRRGAPSEYSVQLLEKQKVRLSYGITEKQLSNYVKRASASKGAGAIDRFYQGLESRLDNAVYRMGLAPSRRAARQMVSHGHFVVRGHKVTVPSYALKSGDVIQVREGSKTKKIFEGLAEKLKDHQSPAWLTFDPVKMEGKVVDLPQNTETFLDLNAVLEFYSR